MARSALAVPQREEAERIDRLDEPAERSYRFEADRLRERAAQRTLPPAVTARERRTVTITGHGAEGFESRNGTRPSSALRHRQLKRHERDGFQPDRAVMWAFLLGVLLILAAAGSAHAAVLAHFAH
jgi:hypothetical protein